MARIKTAAERVADRFLRMRDMFEGAPPAEEEITLRVMADFHPEYELLEPQAPEFTAKMPGDNPHPLAKVGLNPYPQLTVPQLMRAMREDKIPRPMRRPVRAYLEYFKLWEAPPTPQGAKSTGGGGPAPAPFIPAYPGQQRPPR